MLLFVAAQAGFLDGPRVLANMSLDRWLPGQFSLLSERLVIKNGIVLMGGAALVLMLVSRGSVSFLIVLYAINVFITFCLSQAGMVRHWWKERGTVRAWKRKILINGIGLLLTGFILISQVVLKFQTGGWITLLITGSLVARGAHHQALLPPDRAGGWPGWITSWQPPRRATCRPLAAESRGRAQAGS